MVFWISFLVFMAGMMLYMLFPRNDLYKINMYQEEGNIVTFINQHQAAKDLMYQVVSWNPQNAASYHIYLFPYDDLKKMLPAGMTSDIYTDKNKVTQMNPSDAIPESEGSYTSAIVCLDGSDNLVKCPAGSNKFVITYGYLPDWWTDRSHPNGVDRQAWFKALLKRTYGSKNCGLLSYRGLSDSPLYAIDNSQTYKGFTTVGGITNVIYPSITNALTQAHVSTCSSCVDKLSELFFCMTPVSDLYEGTPNFYWDILNNTGTGSDTSNLGTPLAGTLSSDAISITLSDNYTISGVVSASNKIVTDLPLLGTSIKTTCTDKSCQLTVGNTTITGIPLKKGYAFTYTVDSSRTNKQILKVYYSENKSELTEKQQTSTTTPTTITNPTLYQYRTDNQTPTLQNIRIYSSVQDDNILKKNIKIDQKRLGI